MAITREIDRMAQDIFRISISPAWFIREQHPDVHIDYFVEIADKSGPLGNIFGVQLKGTISPNYSGKYIKIPIKTQHIAYYLDKVKTPIFLIVIDVRRKKGYYLFIQQWSRKLTNQGWRDQSRISIKLPIENSIDNIDNFKIEILHAENYMRELWPSSITAAINYEKDKLENLDQRFEVSISHTDGKINYGLKARENVSFNLYFNNPEPFRKGFIDLYDRGLPFSINTTDILKVEGSPLLEHAWERSLPGKLTIEPTRKIKSTLIIATLNDLNEETSSLYDVRGFMVGGRKEVRFEGGIDGTPFKIYMFIDLIDQEIKKSPQFEITFEETRKWEGSSVLLLPFFDRLLSFVQAIRDGNAIKIICEIKGNRMLEGKSFIDNDSINYVLEYLTVINKTRVIARNLNIDLILPKIESIKNDDIDLIDLIYNVIDKGEFRHNGSNTIIRATISPNKNFYEIIGKENTEKSLLGPLIIKDQKPKYKIFGRQVDLGPLKFTLTYPKVIIVETDKLNGDKKIKLIGTEKSEFIVNKAEIE